MGGVAFAVFVLGIPMSIALGLRFSDAPRAFRAVGTLALAIGVSVATLLSTEAGWLSAGTVTTVGIIATLAPLALGMGAWRTPDLIASMQRSFDQVVEPYMGRSISFLGWAHMIFNLGPSALVGVEPSKAP